MSMAVPQAGDHITTHNSIIGFILLIRRSIIGCIFRPDLLENAVFDSKALGRGLFSVVGSNAGVAVLAKPGNVRMVEKRLLEAIGDGYGNDSD
jgi:hypothetical protein